MPILADHYGRVLTAGGLRLERRGGSFVLRHNDHALPISPRSAEAILHRAAGERPGAMLSFLADSFARLPHSAVTDRDSVRRRHRDKDVLRALLDRLCQDDASVAAAIDSVLERTNTDHDALDDLLSRQNYRVAHWRTAGQELDYRRFFDVTTLASLRTEDEQVFRESHELVLGWLSEGLVDGLRIDHPDGLRDPFDYLRRLRQHAPRAWIVVEKILEPGEDLPSDWPVAGTTGYDFLNMVNGLLIDPRGETPLTELYVEITGQSADFATVVREKKHHVLRELFAADIHRLVGILTRICHVHRRTRDFTRRDLTSALRELIACFPVYRTYARPNQDQLSPQDHRSIQQAIDRARQHRPDIDAELFDFLGELLSGPLADEDAREFVMRFQQQTGPVMAKGVEDTAFYCFNRLISLNEVGSDPGRFSVSLADFHRYCGSMAQAWPLTMLATTTHDTKRSEDVRARLNLISEIPERWSAVVRDWMRRNEPYRTHGMPERNLEYLYYQTLVGAWPLELERALAYMEKAAREAKVHTSWTRPDDEYEAALRRFIAQTLADAGFRASLESFVASLQEAGWINSLSQTLLKLTAPGIPDIYQGAELGVFTLVDPDNRRPVDFEIRRQLLAELPSLAPGAIWQRRDQGLAKLWLLRQGLALRRRAPDAFTGGYEPLSARGAKSDHVIAFLRGEQVIAVAPRWPLRLAGDWGNTSLALPTGPWSNTLTGETFEGAMPLSELVRSFPIALLVRTDAA
jgi:(1->4)-alpha-D-glucan 1-alpha-D-glucosylmutase